MPPDNTLANYISSISAFFGFICAVLAFLSYRKSVEQNNASNKDLFVSALKNNLDGCYLSLNDFFTKFSGIEETIEKRISRDKIIYLLETLRVDFESNNHTSTITKCDYISLEMKMSDITYEENYEKISRDLGVIKNSIYSLKKSLT